MHIFTRCLLDSIVLSASLTRTPTQRLEKLEPAAYYPIIEEEFQPQPQPPEVTSSPALAHSDSANSLQFKTIDLPLVIRERDVGYQFQRVVLFERLLKAYPYKKHRIFREARIDIPPLYRAEVWAALLEVEVRLSVCSPFYSLLEITVFVCFGRSLTQSHVLLSTARLLHSIHCLPNWQYLLCHLIFESYLTYDLL